MKKVKSFAFLFICILSICFFGCKNTPSDEGTGYKGETVTMGSWPQSLVDVTGIALTATGKTYDGKNAEYLGDDGNKYVKVNDSYYKIEPISWRVIEYNSDGSKKLLADKIYSRIVYYGYDSSRDLAGTTIYANNYKYSNIRAYLNSTKNQYEIDSGTATFYDVDWTNAGFLTTAFTSSELTKIKTVLVDNSAKTTTSNSNIFVCENTEDKVYLLSYKEVTKQLYGFGDWRNNASRIMKTTAYARANGAYQSDNKAYGGYWWVRTPDDQCSFGTHYIGDDGTEERVSGVGYLQVGVVPVMTVTE